MADEVVRGLLIKPDGDEQIVLKGSLDFYDVLGARSIELKRKVIDGKKYAIICDKYDDPNKPFTVIKEENGKIVEAIAGNVFVSNIDSSNMLKSLSEFDVERIGTCIKKYQIEGEDQTYLQLD